MDANVSYSMSFDHPYEPPQYNWRGINQRQIVEQHSGDIRRCLGGGTGVQLTIYVFRGGKVESAGATSDTIEMYEPAQCLAKAAKSWTFSGNPGNIPAKVTIEF